MQIVLTAKSDELASCLKSKIINCLSSCSSVHWKYRSFSESEEAVYYNADENSMSADKPDLLFVLEQEQDRVTFFPASFRCAQKADFVLCCTHVGSLTEMLLYNFYNDFIRFEIVK